MFFFPYTTDAPIYHWPVATVVLIGLNIGGFLSMLTGNLHGVEWMLFYGNGLHPQQWLTSMFTHASVGHLAGNMMFLWVFGLIVEGKLGWWKFLACYLGIGVTQAFLQQLVMLGYSGDVPGSMGASTAIYGIMAMAAVWAPMNEITFVYVYCLMMRPFSGDFDVKILMMAAFYVSVDLLLVMFLGGHAGSSLLHLSGVALGLPLGIALLKFGLVDCEGWDAFHVLKGDYGPFKNEPEPEEVFDKMDRRQRKREAAQQAAAKEQLQVYLQAGNTTAAFVLLDKMKALGRPLQLDSAELLVIIKGLHKAGRWAESAPLMAELIERFPDGADSLRIKLAQICVVELQRPAKALELLDQIDVASLAPEHRALVKKIRARATQMQAEGVLELDSQEW